MAENSFTSRSRALEKLIDGTDRLLSSDGWRRALELRRYFPRYSFLNTSLILVQRPTAMQVAGYRTWQKLGRQVRKGEQGISILAPILTPRDDNPEELVPRAFKQVYVFDINQTDGEPVSIMERPPLLEGSSSAIADAIRALEDYCELLDIDVERVSNSEAALGRYDRIRRTISLRRDLSPLQELATFIHECAHAVMHSEGALGATAELEAESCAFLVLQELGLDTSTYTFTYIANWANDLESVVRAGERAVQVADTILEKLLRNQASLNEDLQLEFQRA